MRYGGEAVVVKSSAGRTHAEPTSAPRSALEVGEELAGEDGVYRIGASIGKGGMGEVFRAVHASSGEAVAIKVLVLKDDEPTARLRFAFEGQALREIRHPNVVPVLATGIRKHDGLAWMAMPLLRGKALNQVLERHGSLPMPWAVSIIRDVCRGLQAIHSVAVHRDIKPANLFLCLDGVVQILDLGAGKFLYKGLVKTTTGFQLGTLPYMSPEQIRSQPIDASSDIFSTAVVLYELLTGHHPFLHDGDPGWFEMCTRIVGEPHVPPAQHAPWLPPYLVEILNKGLSKKPGKRFRSAEEMRDVLSSALHRLAADLGHVEPIETFAAGLVTPEEAARDVAELSKERPRTTLPMTPPQSKIIKPRLVQLAEPREGERTTLPMDPAAPSSSPLSPSARKRALSLAATDEVSVSVVAPLRDSGVVIKALPAARAVSTASSPLPPSPPPGPTQPPIPARLAMPVLGFSAPSVPVLARTLVTAPPRRRRWLIPVVGGMAGAVVGFAALLAFERGPDHAAQGAVPAEAAAPLPEVSRPEAAPPGTSPPSDPAPADAPPIAAPPVASSTTASPRRPPPRPVEPRARPGVPTTPATARGRLFGADP